MTREELRQELFIKTIANRCNDMKKSQGELFAIINKSVEDYFTYIFKTDILRNYINDTIGYYRNDKNFKSGLIIPTLFDGSEIKHTDGWTKKKYIYEFKEYIPSKFYFSDSLKILNNSQEEKKIMFGDEIKKVIFTLPYGCYWCYDISQGYYVQCIINDIGVNFKEDNENEDIEAFLIIYLD